MVEGELDQPAQRRHGRQILQVLLGLDLAHAAVRVFQHRQVQALFAAEVVVNHALAGARGGRNLVDARAAQPLVGKLCRRHLQDAGHGTGRVVGARGQGRLGSRFGDGFCGKCTSK